jgi:hypothetical protein
MQPRFSLEIQEATWRPVYTLARGFVLQKGVRGLYKDLMSAVGRLPVQFGCYSWQSRGVVHYCGSFSHNYKDYLQGRYTSNLQGRVHNYLHIHKASSTGRTNTNLNVFNKINHELREAEVTLCLCTFTELQIGGAGVSYDEYTRDPALVRAVEELLICTYKRLGECEWNRQ